jgi:two-component system alkaline phosphatase synthesis response regulator PhoP
MAKVLLVEDDNNLREIFDMRLQAEGYKTITAGDGEEALVIAVKEKPDLVIADVMMPKLSGFEMVENMRAAPELASVKVIMMTALGQAEDRARGEKLGVVKYLVKSQVTLEDFVRIVRDVMPPDGNGTEAPEAPAPTDTAAEPAPPEIVEPTNNINQQESEAPMQDDAQTPTNPQPADAPATPDTGAAPVGDASVPSNDSTPSPNPISDAPASPLGDTSGAEQQSTAEETSAVQDQINNFETDPAAGTAPAGDATSMPAADDTAAAPAASDATSMPAVDASAAPASDTGVAPAGDATATPADPADPASDPAAPTDPNNNAL